MEKKKTSRNTPALHSSILGMSEREGCCRLIKQHFTIHQSTCKEIVWIRHRAGGRIRHSVAKAVLYQDAEFSQVGTISQTLKSHKILKHSYDFQANLKYD